ncbi:MAG: ABC transporter permease subunit [Chloracidobacterium sp.]|nr:ABC transporter permease subunit [Chloracidobacterium sp.]
MILFVLLITASAIFLGELTAGQESRVIVNLGLSSILLFGSFISIFVGVSLVWKEIEKRTVYSIFSKPIGRGEFIIGKYLGLCLTILLNVIVMGAGVSLALLYVGGGPLVWKIWGAVTLIFLELSIVTAVAIMFSSFSTPALSAPFDLFCLSDRPFQCVTAGSRDQSRVERGDLVLFGDLLPCPIFQISAL